MLRCLDLDDTRPQAMDALVSQARADVNVTMAMCDDPHSGEGRHIQGPVFMPFRPCRKPSHSGHHRALVHASAHNAAPLDLSRTRPYGRVLDERIRLFDPTITISVLTNAARGRPALQW